MELLRPGSTVPESAGSAARVVEQLCEQTANLHIDIPPVRRSERLIHENVDPTTPGSAVPLQTGFSPAAAEVEPARTQASESKKPKSCRQLCDVWFIRLAPILFVLIWSTGFIAARFGRPYTPPASFLLARFGFSIPLYLIWGGIGRAKWPVGWKQYFHLSVMGILINFCFLGGVWTAVRLGMGAGLSALITGMQPVLTALWVAFRGGRITWLQWVGLAMGAGGLVLVVWQKLGAGEVTAANALLCCGSLVCITVGTLYQKAFVTPCDVRTANCVQMLAAFAVCLPVAIGVDFVPGLHMVWVLPDGDTNWVLIGVVAWSVLGLSLGGGSLLFVMLQRGAATRVAALMFLAPAVTALIAWPVFGEELSWLVAGGILITIAGVGLVVRGPSASAPSPPGQAVPAVAADGAGTGAGSAASGKQKTDRAAHDAVADGNGAASDVIDPVAAIFNAATATATVIASPIAVATVESPVDVNADGSGSASPASGDAVCLVPAHSALPSPQPAADASCLSSPLPQGMPTPSTTPISTPVSDGSSDCEAQTQAAQAVAPRQAVAPQAAAHFSMATPPPPPLPSSSAAAI